MVNETTALLKASRVWVDIITKVVKMKNRSTYLLLGLTILRFVGTLLLLTLTLLEQSLGHQDLVLGWDAPVSHGVLVDPEGYVHIRLDSRLLLLRRHWDGFGDLSAR